MMPNEMHVNACRITEISGKISLKVPPPPKSLYLLGRSPFINFLMESPFRTQSIFFRIQWGPFGYTPSILILTGIMSAMIVDKLP